jgi:tetratricopeptide (TPR) repeat protein
VELTEKGDTAAALDEAQRARDIDPYSPDPLYAKSGALAEDGQLIPAYRVLEQAVAEHPRNPETWLRLAQFELTDLKLPDRALESGQAAATIDPASTRVSTQVQAIRAERARVQQEAAAAQQLLRAQQQRRGQAQP